MNNNELNTNNVMNNQNVTGNNPVDNNVNVIPGTNIMNPQPVVENQTPVVENVVNNPTPVQSPVVNPQPAVNTPVMETPVVNPSPVVENVVTNPIQDQTVNPQPVVAQNIMGVNPQVNTPIGADNYGPVIGNQVPFNNPNAQGSNPNPQPVVTTPEVSEIPKDNTVPEKKKGGSAIIITIIVLLLVIGGLIFFFYRGKDNENPADDNTDTPVVTPTEDEENSFKLASSLCASWFKEKLDLYKTNPEDESLDKSLTSIFTSTATKELNDDLIGACGMETADVDAVNSKIKILDENKVCLLISANADGNYAGMGTFNSDGIEEGTETNYIVAGDCISFE